jgi:hypothetical protein
MIARMTRIRGVGGQELVISVIMVGVRAGRWPAVQQAASP